MKKKVILVLAISMLATLTFAKSEATTKSVDIGARAGYSMDPDQLFFGAHIDFGKLVGPMRLVPNIEFGFGDHCTLMCFNGDLIYDFEGTPWGVGGELGIIHSRLDLLGPSGDLTNTDIGLSVLCDYRLEMSNGKILFLEGKLGSSNSPDFKLTIGYNFF